MQSYFRDQIAFHACQSTQRAVFSDSSTCSEVFRTMHVYYVKVIFILSFWSFHMRVSSAAIFFRDLYTLRAK